MAEAAKTQSGKKRTLDESNSSDPIPADTVSPVPSPKKRKTDDVNGTHDTSNGSKENTANGAEIDPKNLPKVPAPEVTIWNEADPKTPKQTLTKFEEIVKALNDRGLKYEKWASKELAWDAKEDDVLKAYADNVKRIKDEYKFVKTAVVGVLPNATKKEEERKKFLEEHTHGEEEVNFFVAGAACISVRLEEKKEVVRVLCTKDHLFVIPAKTKHWLDMGPNPYFRVLRFNRTETGDVCCQTGDNIPYKFPLYEN